MTVLARSQARLKPVLLLSIAAAALGSCTTKVPPPSIQYDKAAFQPAAMEPDAPKPVAIVRIPEPLPLPGQLLAEPGAVAPDRRSPTARVEAANVAALQEPTAHGYINAIQVYPYVEGALYRLYAAPEQVSDIVLQPSETLVAISAGDTVRWVVGNTSSGKGDGLQIHILVKPFAPGLRTNMVITTDRRTYHLVLESTQKTAMAALSWTYPQDQLFALKAQNAQAEAAMPIDSGLSLEALHFRYAITGDNPPWRPIRAFDDGSKVYIEFPGRIDQGEAPPLFVVGPSGDSDLVNYRVRRNYYVVDRLFAAAELRLGQDPQQVVRISRGDAAEGEDTPQTKPDPGTAFRRDR